jgi:alpha-amylase
MCYIAQWDLGEFEQKGTVHTRWGSKDQLVEAVRVARAHGVDILLDAVLNVCLFLDLFHLH